MRSPCDYTPDAFFSHPYDGIRTKLSDNAIRAMNIITSCVPLSNTSLVPYSLYSARVLIRIFKSENSFPLYFNANIARNSGNGDKNPTVAFRSTRTGTPDVRPFVSFSALSFFIRREKCSRGSGGPRRPPRSLPTCAGKLRGKRHRNAKLHVAASREHGHFSWHALAPGTPYIQPQPPTWPSVAPSWEIHAPFIAPSEWWRRVSTLNFLAATVEIPSHLSSPFSRLDHA